MVHKTKLVVSDFHLGRGRYLQNSLNPLEDFNHDHRFKELLEFYSQGDYEDAEVELVFNGDIFNLIQVDYHGHYPTIITESVSVEKLHTIIEGHPIFFSSLRDFLNHPKHSLTYIIGNHDQEMLWKGTRELLEETLKRPIQWKNNYYLFDGIHIEHGHQYEAVNRIDPTLPFLTQNLPEPILNLPWGTLFTIQFITKLKLRRPAVDKVRPFRMVIWWSLMHDSWMALTSLFSLVCYFFHTRLSKNRYRRSTLRTTLKILREASVFPDLSHAARRILSTPEIHTVIFGHTHVYKHTPVGENKKYINLGSWTDLISMDLESFARPPRLCYARVDYRDDKSPDVRLRYWIGNIPLEDEAVG